MSQHDSTIVVSCPVAVHAWFENGEGWALNPWFVESSSPGLPGLIEALDSELNPMGLSESAPRRYFVRSADTGDACYVGYVELAAGASIATGRDRLKYVLKTVLMPSHPTEQELGELCDGLDELDPTHAGANPTLTVRLTMSSQQWARRSRPISAVSRPVDRPVRSVMSRQNISVCLVSVAALLLLSMNMGSSPSLFKKKGTQGTHRPVDKNRDLHPQTTTPYAHEKYLLDICRFVGITDTQQDQQKLVDQVVAAIEKKLISREGERAPTPEQLPAARNELACFLLKRDDDNPHRTLTNVIGGKGDNSQNVRDRENLHSWLRQLFPDSFTGPMNYLVEIDSSSLSRLKEQKPDLANSQQVLSAILEIRAEFENFRVLSQRFQAPTSLPHKLTPSVTGPAFALTALSIFMLREWEKDPLTTSYLNVLRQREVDSYLKISDAILEPSRTSELKAEWGLPQLPQSMRELFQAKSRTNLYRILDGNSAVFFPEIDVDKNDYDPILDFVDFYQADNRGARNVAERP